MKLPEDGKGRYPAHLSFEVEAGGTPTPGGPESSGRKPTPPPPLGVLRILFAGNTHQTPASKALSWDSIPCVQLFSVTAQGTLLQDDFAPS